MLLVCGPFVVVLVTQIIEDCRQRQIDYSNNVSIAFALFWDYQKDSEKNTERGLHRSEHLVWVELKNS